VSTFQSIKNKTDSRITVALSSFFFETFNAIYQIKIIKSYRWYKLHIKTSTPKNFVAKQQSPGKAGIR